MIHPRKNTGGLKEGKEKQKLANKHNENYELKNEECSICLGEIQEKFTLICGDFFCRECISKAVKNCLKDITKFDKMICPLCQEIIEEDTLKKLLSEEEFDFYQKTTLKIKGIQDKNLIPCPYPDCEGFAEKSSGNKNNIFCCQNNHAFCGKCKECVHLHFLKNGKKHKCAFKYNINIRYLNSQKNIKKCPNCDSWVIKEQKGCNNMTCPNIWCKFEFCWICKKPYDDSHYKNPLSMCFGLSSRDNENYFTREKSIRLIRCIIIFLLLIFIVLPIVIILFPIIEMSLYIIIFVLDGSSLRYIKFKSPNSRRAVYKLTIIIYFLLSLALFPVGYMSLIGIILCIPYFCIMKANRNADDFD